jgi:hypothetical protein
MTGLGLAEDVAIVLGAGDVPAVLGSPEPTVMWPSALPGQERPA